MEGLKPHSANSEHDRRREFGPKGLLYLSLGDGGSGGANGQNVTNLLGSIVRLDVDSGKPYSIPDGNPFATPLWVYGLRNPWRFSIDPQTERVFIGDVGQERYEEINIVGLDGGGTNFGWFMMEGRDCFRAGCEVEDFTAPAIYYSHDEGCSVTGGRVYRGSAIPELNSHYFYADWCGGLVRSFRLGAANHDVIVEEADWTGDLAELAQVTSFGVDNAGELYTVNWNGELHKIVARR